MALAQSQVKSSGYSGEWWQVKKMLLFFTFQKHKNSDDTVNNQTLSIHISAHLRVDNGRIAKIFVKIKA